MKCWLTSGLLLVAVACCCVPQLALATEPVSKARGSGGARVFDPSAAEHFAGGAVLRTWGRKTDRERHRPGYELRAAEVLRWTYGAAVVEGWFGASLRWGPSHLSGSLLHNGGMAGLGWGPLDVKGGVSTALLNLSRSRGDFDFGLFWPRASLSLGLALGPVRLEAMAHVEYAWGWFGADEYVRGVGLVLMLRRGPVGPAFREPQSRE